jgi:uncharacterized protein (TIGR02453 family)
MLQPATVNFLSSLAANNFKPWFDENREYYQAAKADFETLVNNLLTKLSALEPSFSQQQAKDCVFRIFRDVRFGKDKTPYKANFGAFLSKGGRKFAGAGYYLHVEPGGKSFAGGGLWMPESEYLKAIRQEIDYNFDEFVSIINQPTFTKFFSKIEGEKVKTTPAGYSIDNPAIEYLKMKSFVVTTPIGDSLLISSQFEKNVCDVFSSMKSFVDFINRGVDA